MEDFIKQHREQIAKSIQGSYSNVNDIQKGGPGSGKKENGNYSYDQNHQHKVGDRVRSAVVNGPHANKEGHVIQSAPSKKATPPRVQVKHDDGSHQWYAHQDLERHKDTKVEKSQQEIIVKSELKNEFYVPDGSIHTRDIAGQIFRSFIDAHNTQRTV